MNDITEKKEAEEALAKIEEVRKKKRFTTGLRTTCR